MRTTSRKERYTHLVHLEQRPLLHLLERTHLAGVGLAREVDLTIPALSDLRDDLELVDLELDAALAEESALSATIGLELLCILLLSEVALGRVLVEAGAAVLAVGDVAEEVEVVIEEVWRCGGGVRAQISDIDLMRRDAGSRTGRRGERLTELGDSGLSADLGAVNELLLPHLEAGLEGGTGLCGVHVDVVDGHALGGGHAHIGEADGQTFCRVHMDVGQIRVLALILDFGSRGHAQIGARGIRRARGERGRREWERERRRGRACIDVGM